MSDRRILHLVFSPAGARRLNSLLLSPDTVLRLDETGSDGPVDGDRLLDLILEHDLVVTW